MVVGEIPIAPADLARIVARADILAIHVRRHRHVTVQIAAHAPDAEALESVLELFSLICAGATGPYR